MKTSREYLELYRVRAKKTLGQNFLIDEDILKHISESTDIT